jgi:5,10-methylenetetrahydromethanopterin reductase
MRFGFRYPPCAPVQEVTRAIVAAEEAGFDFAWIPDSQLLWRDTWVTVGCAAAATSRIMLGTNVTNPLTRHSTVTASAAASIQEMSPGRFVLGIGTGDSSVRVMGRKTATISRLRDYIDTVRDLTAGEWLEMHGETVHLKGSQGKAVPVYVSATGPNMLKFAGEVADGVILLGGIAEDTLAFSRERIAEGAREAGRDPAGIDVATGLFFRLTDGSSAARKAAQPYAALYALRYRDSLPDFSKAIPESQSTDGIYPDVGHAEDWDRAIELTEWLPEEILDLFVDKYCIMGTEDEVLKRVRYLESLEVEHLYIRGFSSYELPIPEAEAFARSVLPAYAPADTKRERMS